MMSLRGDSNPGPAAYKAAALPLSYGGTSEKETRYFKKFSHNIFKLTQHKVSMAAKKKSRINKELVIISTLLLFLIYSYVYFAHLAVYDSPWPDESVYISMARYIHFLPTHIGVGYYETLRPPILPLIYSFGFFNYAPFDSITSPTPLSFQFINFLINFFALSMVFYLSILLSYRYLKKPLNHATLISLIVTLSFLLSFLFQNYIARLIPNIFSSGFILLPFIIFYLLDPLQEKKLSKKLFSFFIMGFLISIAFLLRFVNGILLAAVLLTNLIFFILAIYFSQKNRENKRNIFIEHFFFSFSLLLGFLIPILIYNYILTIFGTNIITQLIGSAATVSSSTWLFDSNISLYFNVFVKNYKFLLITLFLGLVTFVFIAFHSRLEKKRCYNKFVYISTALFFTALFFIAYYFFLQPSKQIRYLLDFMGVLYVLASLSLVAFYRRVLKLNRKYFYALIFILLIILFFDIKPTFDYLTFKVNKDTSSLQETNKIIQTLNAIGEINEGALIYTNKNDLLFYMPKVMANFNWYYIKKETNLILSGRIFSKEEFPLYYYRNALYRKPNSVIFILDFSMPCNPTFDCKYKEYIKSKLNNITRGNSITSSVMFWVINITNTT